MRSRFPCGSNKIMKSFEQYKNDAKYAAEAAVMIEQPEPSVKEVFAILADKEKGSYDKFKALFQMIGGALPGFADAYRRHIYDPRELPFDPEELSFKGKVGSGWDRGVYVLKPREKGKQTWVIKVRYPWDKDPRTPMQRAKDERAEYQLMKEWYKELPDLIPTEHPLIIESPRKGDGAASAVLQKFLGTKMRDIFEEVPKEELRELIKKDKKLRHDFKTFSRVTVDRAEETGETIDLDNRRNIVLVENEGEEKLTFIDPHDVFSIIEGNKGYKPELKGKLEERLRYLKEVEEICEELDAEETNGNE